MLSYLGWVGAQVAALGLVINLITEGYISVSGGMIIGTIVVLAYTMYGGMWSVAVTDFVQMIIIVCGLIAILWFASDLAGGFDQVVGYDLCGNYHDDWFDSTTGRFPTRDVCEKCSDRCCWSDHWRVRVYPVCFRSHVYRGRGYFGDAW